MRRLITWRNGLLATAGLVIAVTSGIGGAAAQAPGDWDGLVNRINRLQEQIYDLRDGSGGGAMPLQGTQLQGGDPADQASLTLRLNNVEEQLRRLTGQIEQIAFQVQQLNDRFTRFSEDVEFRFQEMGSGQRGDAGSPPAPDATLPPASRTASIGEGSLLQPDFAAPAQAGGSQYQSDFGTAQEYGGSQLQPDFGLPALDGGSHETAAPPRVLGTIPADALRGGSFSSLDGAAPDGAQVGGRAFGGSLVPEEVTSTPLDAIGGGGSPSSASGPEQFYQQTHAQLLRRQFDTAELGFKQFLRKYPDHELAGNAQYWLGETFYARRQYKLAAEAFLKGYEDYAKSPKAADSLVKLGMTLNRLGQQKQACAALVEAERRYPKAQEVRKIAAQERSRNGC